jgi:hypothetical protein
MSIIQQLEDLKEWSQNSARYERRLNFRGGQLVQPGPGRQGYNGKEDFIRNPEGKNQWVLRTDEEIQKIIDNPQYEGSTKKDFRNKEILTRVETEREGLKFQHYGKKKDPAKVRVAQTKRTDWTKEWSHYTTEQKLAAARKSGLELSHIGGKADLVTLNNLAYLPKYTNKLSYFRFEKILNGIQADQNKILADTTMSIADQRAALAELAKADRTLRNKFKGEGYDKIKSRIKTREFAWGMGKKDVIRDPSITIGKGEVGANIPLKTASKAEKSKMVALGKENIKKVPKAPKDFLKLAPPKSTTKTIPAATTKGRIDEALKGDKFKGLRSLLKGELWFAGADFINNLTKGQSIEKSFKKAVETASFDIKDLDADETALIKHATEQGASAEEIGALRNYLNYMKKYKTYERANKMLHYTKENLGEGTGSPEDIGTTWEDVTSARENLKLREGELEDLYNIYTEGTQDMQLGKNTLTKYMNTLAAEEWNKTAGTLIDRGGRTKQGEGLVWNPIGALTRDIGGLFSGKMPTEFYEATIGKFPSLLDPRIKEKEKQIRIMERPAVGVEYPEYQQALEDMKFDFGYALPENHAGGGIAGLSGGKRFGPPPESGPDPYGGGLSSQFNRVRKLTG